jgi:hypothetical protein
VNAQTRIERSDRWTPWGRACAPRVAGSRRADHGTIHPMACGCAVCAYAAARRAFRGDLAIIALGLGAGLAVLALLTLLGQMPR